MKRSRPFGPRCGPLHFASCVIIFIRVCTRHKLRDKGPRPFHSKIFTKLFSFFVSREKIKKENTKSFLQKKIGIRIPIPPFIAHFHFPFYFYFFIFICLTKTKNTMQIFSHFFRHLFRILFLTSHDYENKIQK